MLPQFRRIYMERRMDRQNICSEITSIFLLLIPYIRHMRKFLLLLAVTFVSFQFVQAQTALLHDEWQKGLQEKLKAHHIDAKGQEVIKRIAKHTCACLEGHKEELKDSTKVEEILGGCIATAPKEDMKNALKWDGGHMGAMDFGELISYQLLNDGCTIYLDGVLRMMQHEQKAEPEQVDMPTDEDLLAELSALKIDAKGIPYIKSIEKAVCDCVDASKEKFNNLKDAEDFAGKLGACMETESTVKDFKKLAELAGVTLDKDFSEEVGRICGKRMATGDCPLFLDIITKNIDKFK